MHPLILALFFTTAAAGQPPVVAIDAGHGGKDRGAVIGGRVEADIVLAVSRAMGEALAKSGAARPFLTRSSDTFIALSDRVLSAEDAGAEALLSLHVDNVRGRRGRGVIVYIYGRNKMIPKGPPREPGEVMLPAPPRAQIARSRRLAAHIGRRLRAAGIKTVRYVDIGAFAVLKGRGVPSVLVELGNMRDDKEAAALSRAPFQKKMAAALAEAVGAYLEEAAGAETAK